MRLSELSECTLVMPEVYKNIPGCSHHLWGKVEKLIILALGGWLGHHHRGVLMAVGHGVWKCSEPLFGQVQWLGIAIHDPIGSSEQGIGVSGTQQRPLHAVPHGLPSETSRRGTRGGTRGGTSADINKIDLDFKIRAFLVTLYTFWSD